MTEWVQIPSFPSYEINSESYEIRNRKTGRTVFQKDGIVRLYQKSTLISTTRSVHKLYEEALFCHNQPSDPHNQPLTTLEEISSEALTPSSELASDLLASILNRYKNIPVEDLSHKECIDLLRVLMDKTKKEPTPKREEWDGYINGYITPEMYESIYQKYKNRDYSGNNLKDVEAIYREYAPRNIVSHDKARQPLRCVR